MVIAALSQREAEPQPALSGLRPPPAARAGSNRKDGHPAAPALASPGIKLEIADIFRQYGPAYRAKFGERMPSSQLKVMFDIERCRTEVLGGQIYSCEHCAETHYSYHSCQNRHCPKCQHERGEQWLARQQQLLLPVNHFMVTFTLPAELRAVARSHQQTVYHLLFRSSAAALQELALDPRFVGGQIGMVGVLHTWGRDLSYHPHVHYLVPGGGLATDGLRWLPARAHFLVHVKPLGHLFRAKFRAELKQTALFEQIPAEVWQKEWVVHSKAVDNGQAALKYLAPYIFRVAISNNRMVKLAEGQVTFRYTPSGSQKSKLCTLPAEEFIRRSLACNTCCPRALSKCAISQPTNYPSKANIYSRRDSNHQ